VLVKWLLTFQRAVVPPSEWSEMVMNCLGQLGLFTDINPSDLTMALGSTQPLTEMSTRRISWGVNAAGVQG
jgi:hypothetical protein